MIKKIIIFNCLWIIFENVSGQNTRTLDSLFNQLELSTGTSKAEVYRVLGDYASDVSDYASALNYHQKALEIFISEKDKQGERNTLLSISSDYSRMRYFDKSLEYVNLLLNKAAPVNDARNMAGAYNNKALIELYSNQDDSAEVSLYKAWNYAQQISDTLFIKTAIVNNLALFHSQKGDFESASSFFRSALQLSEKTKNLYSVAGVYLNMANLLLEQKKYGDALDTANLALKISAENKYLEIQLPATHLLSEIYEKTGNKDSMLVHLKKSIPLHDSLNARQNNENIRNAEIKNAIKDKEHENQLLNKNNEIKSLQIESQQQWLYSLGVGLFFFFILFTIVFIQYRQLQNTNKSLVERNLEIMQSENQLRETHEQLYARLNESKQNKKTAALLQGGQKIEVLSSLIKAFEEQKIFTKPDLSINSLANELKTNRTYLSQLIKEHYNKGFTELINNYRVSEARRLLSDSKNLNFTVDHIGELAGFSSRATFYAVFKQYTGVTPSFFQKSVNRITLNKDSGTESNRSDA